jgi:hypothetical protein
MSRLTISQRLWLGLGVILGLFSLADFVSLQAANRVDVTLQTLVSSGDERRGAGYTMRDHLAAMVRAVQSYLTNLDPQQRMMLRKSEIAFEQALSGYHDIASIERSQTLALELSKAYAATKRQAHDVMRLRECQSQESRCACCSPAQS